jgi:hypothetical protein
MRGKGALKGELKLHPYSIDDRFLLVYIPVHLQVALKGKKRLKSNTR